MIKTAIGGGEQELVCFWIDGSVSVYNIRLIGAENIFTAFVFNTLKIQRIT